MVAIDAPVETIIPATLQVIPASLFATEPKTNQLGPAGVLGSLVNSRGLRLACYYWPVRLLRRRLLVFLQYCRLLQQLCCVVLQRALSLCVQAKKPVRGCVLFVHGHGAYLLHELLRVDVRALRPPCSLCCTHPCSPTQNASPKYWNVWPGSPCCTKPCNTALYAL